LVADIFCNAVITGKDIIAEDHFPPYKFEHLSHWCYQFEEIETYEIDRTCPCGILHLH
jgi:hypothetical protein